MNRLVTVSVPASSGNLGPGFDVLGLALSLRNQIEVRVLESRTGSPVIRIVGEGESSLPRDSRNHIFKTISWLFQKARRPLPKLEIICVNRIPLARGLGSSSAAYLSALLAANRLLDDRFDWDQILLWAAQFEGHPDNVAPALLGGARASVVTGQKVVSAALPAPKVSFLLAVPDFELSTKKARKVLPTRIPLKDAVANLASVALLPHAFEKRLELLKDLLNDRWHEPYRAKLIPGFYSVKTAALKAGALGVTLSGAGPTVMAMARKNRAKFVAHAMQTAFRKSKVRCQVLNLSIDTKGAVLK